MKEGFRRCHDCGAVTQKTGRLINFHPLEIAVYLTLFVIVF